MILEKMKNNNEKRNVRIVSVLILAGLFAWGYILLN